MPIIITVQGDKRLRDSLGRIRSNLPIVTNRTSWMVVQKCAKHIRKSASGRFSFPRGYLENSIKPRKIGNNRYAVIAAHYSWFVDMGRRAGRAPPLSPKFAQWARKAGISPYKLRASIARKGTRPRQFIRAGLLSARPDWLRSLREHYDYFIRSGGKVA